MSGWTIVKAEEVPDAFDGKYAGSMHFLGGALGSEQVTITYRFMPPGAGGKGGYGHRHKTQEEIYFVIAGKLEFKLEEEVIDVGARTAVRIPPSTVRSVWNGGPDDAELLIVSTTGVDPREDGEMVEGFWPDDDA